ncbi:MAG TPA: hypothetical protein VD962_04525 [Rubricoccaceae bacterium]|nr:hypothetical protein [Rubricoccaceae bacterium]
MSRLLALFLAALVLAAAYVLCCGLASAQPAAEEPVALVEEVPAGVPEQLRFLAPFVGTWRATLGEQNGQPTVDVARWAWGLGGKALRVIHSVNDGVYGGETVVVWDAARGVVAYYYFTTAGFYTQGTMTPLSGGTGFTTYEEVAGNAEGITAVRATYTTRPEGGFAMHAEYQQEGAWHPAREATYARAEGAEVVLDF